MLNYKALWLSLIPLGKFVSEMFTISEELVLAKLKSQISVFDQTGTVSII